MSKSKTTQTVSLPAWQESQMKELYAAGKGLAGQPFVPYTGPMVAGLNPDQLRAAQATRGLFETGMEYDPLTGLRELAQQPSPTLGDFTTFQAPTIGAVQTPSAATIQETPTFGGAQVQQIAGPQAAQIGGVQAPQFRGLLDVDIGAYQSPYQQQVIDLAMSDIQRQADIARGESQARAIGAGAFGGSRSALLEQESQRPFIEQIARTSAGLRQAGFEQAQQAAQADLARQQQLGLFGAEQAQQRALQQAQLAQQAGLVGYEGDLQRAQQQAQLAQQAGLAGQDIAAQRAARQAELQQQAGMFGAELGQSRLTRQAELAQQAGLSGQDIQARMAMMAPELELRSQAQRAGILGAIGGEQMQRLGLLGGIGAQQQQLQQRALDAARGEFERSLAYGPQQLGLLQAGTGTPLTSTTTSARDRSLGEIGKLLSGIGSLPWG